MCITWNTSHIFTDTKVFKYPSLVASFFDVCMSLVCELVDDENNMCCLNLNE